MHHHAGDIDSPGGILFMISPCVIIFLYNYKFLDFICNYLFNPESHDNSDHSGNKDVELQARKKHMITFARHSSCNVAVSFPGTPDVSLPPLSTTPYIALSSGMSNNDTYINGLQSSHHHQEETTTNVPDERCALITCQGLHNSLTSTTATTINVFQGEVYTCNKVFSQ